ncbi:aminotransferase class V-fold PLP-dependent enzyme [Thioalkalivibrio sp. HK1]|uniref:aminotransferase class V-fold PLP-dependent enzyme n=1 Tax=Thioalkalivibrio sp. HK1 TaxID=1469245 RepID=UPI000472846F|nr:aminotransferase class V-fold PLP-dependent enzyme [Thioalkalivibrio sp. HK1]
MTIACQRHRFDIPEDLAWFNCAYMGPLMHEVMEAGMRGVRIKGHPWRIKPPDFFADPDRARAGFARLVNAEPQDIAIVPAASYGMSIAARNLPLEAGRNIVLLADQFPSNVYPWHEAARRAGAEVVAVEVAPGDDLSAAVVDAIDERTAIAALPHCRWTDGALIDLEAVAAKIRKTKAALALDLSQSAGALPVDMARIAPDFAVSACYKWLLGPYSFAFLYVRADRQSGEPLEYGWGARKGARDFARLVDYQDEFAPGAKRFDMGESANFHLVPMAIAALERILEWGVEEIAETLAKRSARIVERADTLGFQSLAQDRRAGHFLGLRCPPGTDPLFLSKALARENVHVGVRGDCLRITGHLYNNQADEDRLLAALEKALFGSRGR